MRELEIVFTKSKKKFPIFSWLIRLWTWKSYSHVAKRHEVKDWGRAYFHANEGKVNYEYHTVFHKKHKIEKKYILSIPKELRQEINKSCFQEAGNKYATMQNLGIVLVDVCALFGKKIENPFRSGRNCSELIYTKVFLKMKPDLDYNPDTIKPHHIEEIINRDFKHLIIDKD